MTRTNHPRTRTWLRTVIGYGLAIAAVVFAAHGVNAGRETLTQTSQLLSWPAIIGAALLLLAHALINREGFLTLSKSMGIAMTPTALRRLWGQSLLTKYIPGGIWQILGRSMLMKSQGIPHKNAITVGLVEQVISLMICSLLALAAFLAMRVAIWIAIFVLAAGALALALVCKTPWIKHSSTGLLAVVLYAVAMPFYFGAYALLAAGVPLLALCAQLFAGTVAGMLVFFAPGGLGIRESVATLFDAGATSGLLGALIAARMVMIAVETGVMLTTLIWSRCAPDTAPKRELHVRRIVVAGIAMSGSGYPNARNTIAMLRTVPEVEVINRANWLPENFYLWRFAQYPLPKKLAGMASLGLGTLLSLARSLLRHKRGDVLYLPYPSFPAMWLLSWLPAHLRPTTICDAYVTLWDSFYQDRRMGNEGGALSRHLFIAESRALRSADRVLVDTTANAEHIHHLFGITRSNIHAFPLAVDIVSMDGRIGASLARTKRNAQVNVLFFGTFVPLQGTSVIAEAIVLLRDQDGIAFTLVGDGQQASEISGLLDRCPNTTWIREWQTPEQLAKHLAHADICLGIFGGKEKAARVLPLKLYMALAHGKAVITQVDYGTPEGAPVIPALAVQPTAAALAAAIVELSNDPQERTRLSAAAHAYFQQHLSEQALRDYWRELILCLSQ